MWVGRELLQVRVGKLLPPLLREGWGINRLAEGNLQIVLPKTAFWFFGGVSKKKTTSEYKNRWRI